MSAVPEGFFVDWSGNLRKTTDPGGGFVCEVDLPARYVGVKTAKGTLMHEATFYKDQASLDKAGIKARLVPGSQPWGEQL
jgi:hypothetical protein